jgi:hypothetical protein
MPGFGNHFSDETSRHPAGLSELNGEDDDMESQLASIYKPDIENIRGIRNWNHNSSSFEIRGRTSSLLTVLSY